MGVDASVMCACYQSGKAKPCPFPAHFKVDEEGYPALDLPYEGNEDRFDTFEEWLATCCEHPYMDYINRYIGGWKEYQAFLRALEQIGADQFPTLINELPQSNHGVTSAPAAAAALVELNRFQSLSDGLTRTFLVNSETDEPLGASTMAYGGLFGLDGRTGLHLGFDEAGFFVKDAWEMNRELFRAMRFEQRVLDSEALDKPQQFEFIDLDSGRRFTSGTPVKVFARDETGQLRQEYPRYLHVEQRTIDPAYFNAVLTPLKAVFSAAVETGNPVRWS